MMIKDNNAQYIFDSYIRSDGFKGIRNVINYMQNVKGWNFNGIFNLTNSNTPTDKGYYFRPSLDLNKTFSSLHNYTFGANYSLEYNKTQ